MTRKILLDTDIGSDIDDAVCLAYLLAQPDCNLLGVTTVTGEAIKRAQMVSAMCKVAGKDIPIYPGVEKPLLIAQQQPHAPQAEALRRWDHDSDFPRGEAIEFLRRTIRQHPGEITLLTIGPLTNAALLFAVDAEIPHLLKEMVMMGGVFKTSDQKEWNAMLDPHATAIVFNAPLKRLRAVGLDVTRQVVMQSAEVRQRFQTDLLRPVLDFAEVWFTQRDAITFHDPLAAAAIFDESICGFEAGYVEIELNDPKLRGFTRWKPDHAEKPHEVALTVDSARFFAHFFSVQMRADQT